MLGLILLGTADTLAATHRRHVSRLTEQTR